MQQVLAWFVVLASVAGTAVVAYRMSTERPVRAVILAVIVVAAAIVWGMRHRGREIERADVLAWLVLLLAVLLVGRSG